MTNNEFKNVIILGELDYFLVTRFDKDNDRGYKTFEYTPKHLPLQQNEDGAATVNGLYIINNTLEKIAEMKMANNDILNEVCYLTIPDKINTAISRGTYKNWIKNDGLALSGKQYSEREIDEWARFDSLYKTLFSDVNFRGAAYFSMHKPKFNVDNVNKNKRLINLMRNKIEEHKVNMLDAIITSC